MNKLYITLLLFCGASTILAQTHRTQMYTAEQVKYLQENEEVLAAWYEDLKTPGVKVDGDKMIFTDEARKLMGDAAYRKLVYKDVYTFIDVRDALGKSEIKKAFWQMINLYPEHKEDVLRFIYAYDTVFPTDEVVTSAFYTYAFFDPRITKLDSGKPEIYRPDEFEKYFRYTQEIVSYIVYFRKEKEKKQ